MPSYSFDCKAKCCSFSYLTFWLYNSSRFRATPIRQKKTFFQLPNETKNINRNSHFNGSQCNQHKWALLGCMINKDVFFPTHRAQQPYVIHLCFFQVSVACFQIPKFFGNLSFSYPDTYLLFLVFTGNGNCCWIAPILFSSKSTAKFL